MKIVHITFNRSGGAAQAAWNVHKALLNAGFNSWFFTIEPRSSEDLSLNWKCWQPKKLNFFQKCYTRLRRYYYDILKSSRYSSIRKSLKSFDELEKSFNGEIISLPISYVKLLEDPIFKDAQIVHLHWVTLMIDYGRFFAMAKGRFKIIWTLHDLNPIMGLFNYEIDLVNNPQCAQLENNIKFYKLRCLNDYGNRINAICPSNWIAEKVTNSEFYNYYKPQRINYSFNFENWLVLDKFEARVKYHFSPLDRIVLCVVESIAVLRKKAEWVIGCAKEFSDIKFILVGGNPMQEPMPDNVVITGFISDRKMLNYYYGLCDCILITSIEDNLPNVLIESLASGRPVLAFGTGGMAEHVNDGFNGILSYDFTLNGLKLIVRKFFSMSLSNNAMAIREYAEKHFFPKLIVNQHITLYKSLIKE